MKASKTITGFKLVFNNQKPVCQKTGVNIPINNRNHSNIILYFFLFITNKKKLLLFLTGFEDVPDFLTILLNLIRQKLGGQTVENDKKTVKSTLMCDHCDGVIMHH